MADPATQPLFGETRRQVRAILLNANSLSSILG